MLKLNEKITSVDTPIGGDRDKALLDVLSDERGMGPELESQEDDMRSSIVHWLEELNPSSAKCWPAVSVCSAMNRPPWKTWAPRLV